MRGCNYNVRVAPAAYDKMFQHVRFLANVSVSAAEALYTELEEAVNTLEQNPGSYPIYSQHSKDLELRFKLCAKRYRIVFEIVADTVYIYDIQDCRQGADKNLIE